MNYLTAILAFPLFNFLVLFELYIYWKAPEINNPLNLRLARSYLGVSVLQTISVWFWFFGFVFSKVNSVFGEGYAPGEECNCFGLVGAEVLLSIFQWIMTCSTAYQALYILRVSTSKQTKKRSGRDLGDILFYSFCALLAVYTGLCWITAHNRRCPQGEKYLITFQHFFYPVYLSLDLVLYGMTAGKLMKLRQKLEESVANRVVSKTQGGSSVNNSKTAAGTSENAAKQPNIMASADAGSSGSTPVTTTGNGLGGGTSTAAAADVRNNKSLRSMRETVRTYTLALVVTGVTGVIGIIVFFLQFVANIPEFSLIACLYCLLMYMGYVARRTPFLIMWCKWEPPTWMNKCLGKKPADPLLPVTSSGTASVVSAPSSALGGVGTGRR